MSDKKHHEATADDLTIVYLMARSDGLTKTEAHAAVNRHAETGCGYAWKHSDDDDSERR